jgi:hypothetical protein
LDLVTHRHNWGEDRVYFHDDDGQLRHMPAKWTSIVAADPVAEFGAGRSPFRVLDLLELVALMDALVAVAPDVPNARKRRRRSVK